MKSLSVVTLYQIMVCIVVHFHNNYSVIKMIEFSSNVSSCLPHDDTDGTAGVRVAVHVTFLHLMTPYHTCSR